MHVGVVPFALGANFPDLEDSWRAAEVAGFEALWTIDHSTPTTDLRPAWEASALLVAMASATRTIAVGVLVFDVLMRHPFTLAGSVAVAQAVSNGRVRVGLGIGDEFSRLDHEAMGIPFPAFWRRIEVLEGCCQVLPALWRGEAVTAPSLGLVNAELGPVNIALPPLVIGGGSRRVMEMAVRHAQRWNMFTDDPEVYAARSEMLATVERTSGPRDPLMRSVYLFIDRIKGSVRRLLGAFEAAGADEVALVVMRPTGRAIFELARQAL